MVGTKPLDRLMLEVVDRELDTPAYPGVMEFRSAMIARGANAAALDAILDLNGIAMAAPQPVNKAPSNPGCTTPTPTSLCR